MCRLLPVSPRLLTWFHLQKHLAACPGKPVASSYLEQIERHEFVKKWQALCFPSQLWPTHRRPRLPAAHKPSLKSSIASSSVLESPEIQKDIILPMFSLKHPSWYIVIRHKHKALRHY
jgi:hypothetical protein